MAEVSFTRNLARHVNADACVASGSTIGEVLNEVFTQNPELKSYIVDDQGAVRKHMGVFVDGDLISDRTKLTDPVNADSKVHVVQALSGG